MLTYRYLSLFSGIGGFEIAAEIANQAIGHEAFEVAALCEINPFGQQRLQHHYPLTPLIPDVKRITVDLIRELGAIDGIVGGSPCQDISYAGKGAGLAGERSGLFYEIIRIIRLVRPQFVYLENVAALVNRGLSDVLRAFAEIGYDAEWSVIPCSQLGGSHKRERIWIIAYPNSTGLEAWQCEPAKQTAIAKVERHSCSFDYETAVKSLVRSCHDGLPFGLDNGSAYLLRLADIPDFLEYAADSLPIAHRKEALQAYGNAIVPQVGAIGFLRIYKILCPCIWMRLSEKSCKRSRMGGVANS